MLRSLAIRDVVLIDQLSLTFRSGLCVLTGETGAGKSILLDALGLALGARGDTGLIRHGAHQAVVTAAFELDNDHPARGILADQGLESPGDGDGAVVVRRVLGRDGRSRALVNDQPASVGLLRRLGATLVEVEGQFAEQGLLDPGTHRAILDAFGGLEEQAARVAAAHRAWRAAESALASARAELEVLRGEEETLRHALAEIEALDPKAGEEAGLADERTMLMHRERLLEAMNAAAAALAGATSEERGAETAIRLAQRFLEGAADKAAGRLDEAIRALDAAAIEVAEAEARLASLGTVLEHEPDRLEKVEERLFALRAVARKHGVEVEALPELRDRLSADLAALDDGGGTLALCQAEAERARGAYLEAASVLSRARRQAAGALDRAVAAELPPLKLDKASLVTRITPLEEGAWSESGTERIAFEVSTNPGTPPGPLGRVASGGELARFLLALKVVVSRRGPAPTLVFDEVDRGIGGAAAAAVGDRLGRLGRTMQVLVVTHSPQVAARGDHHWRIEKRGKGKGVATRVEELADAARREEIARLLSGARVTEEARAAADSLLEGGAPAHQPA
jgi:DNA repair protein RecN (Recombination protein N)